ncbi:hypothetical protein QYF61_003248 [Mycteria americana]|uniref:Uncharacterized protein n=1 Tax=Mycteria americana TaxID=33587 RepID=A0AAN7P2B1_MYCAM|nr:hypothetical protein QYF61_003248 [Mycteria americana]
MMKFESVSDFTSELEDKDEEEDNETYVVFGLKKNDKLQCVYSGRKNTLSTASLAEGVCLACRDPPAGLGAGLLVVFSS